MPKLIIGLVGLQGCGKGTAADLLKEEYGAGYFRFSAILSDILRRLGVESSRDHFIALSTALRQAFGEDVLSYAIAQDAVGSTEDIIIIDGIRRPQDIIALEPLPQFQLIAVTADQTLRFERMKGRGEKAGESQMTWEQFLATEQAETERTIPDVMARATITIPNDGTREEFAARVRDAVNHLRAQQA